MRSVGAPGLRRSRHDETKALFVPSDRFYARVDPPFILGGAAEFRPVRRELHDLQRDDQRRYSRPKVPDRDGLPIPLRLEAGVPVFRLFPRR